MSEPAHVKIARQLRALADRLERKGMPSEAASQMHRFLEAVERLMSKREAMASVEPESPSASARDIGAVPGTARVWSDGSCVPNPGPGGWAAIIELNGAREEISGAAPASTNNIMEMTAAIEALRRLPPGTAVTVTSDSEYLVKGMTQWLPGWKRNRWRTSSKEAVKNQDLWQALDHLASERRVRWEWVEGHAGHPENERCDRLANAARERLMAGKGRGR